MKILFILISSLALVSVAFADQPKKGKKKQAAQHHAQGAPGMHAGAPGMHAGAPGMHAGGGQHSKAVSAAPFHHKGAGQSNVHVNKFQSKKFALGNKWNPQVTSVKFKAGYQIHGAQNWHGAKYVVFRNYRPQWHDRGWWHGHHNRIVFVYGAPYYWDAGWWYPAWGYDASVNYAYDGPIYAYNDLPPDQVVANVQSALQEQGYYTGEVDGLLGPLTRAAVARYQEDHGLYVTSAIDEPTLDALGMA